MPKSTTSAQAGSARSDSRRTTSTPKPSSPRKTLPMPAISTFIGSAPPPRDGRRTDALAGARARGHAPDRRPGPPPGAQHRRSRARSPRPPRPAPRAQGRGCRPAREDGGAPGRPPAAGPRPGEPAQGDGSAPTGPSGGRGCSSLPPPADAQLPDRPMETHQLRRRQRLGPLEQAPSPFVTLPQLRLLRLAQGEDAQGEELIDLG